MFSTRFTPRLSLLFLLFGCRSPHSFPGPAECRLGTGALHFVDLHDGDRVPINPGSQGGYHVWGAARIRWMTAEDVKLKFTLSRQDGSAVTTVTPTVTLEPLAPGGPDLAVAPDGAIDADGGSTTDGGSDFGAEGWAETLANFVFLPDPGAVTERTLRLHFEATDADARRCTDERWIVPYRP